MSTVGEIKLSVRCRMSWWVKPLCMLLVVMRVKVKERSRLMRLLMHGVKCEVV